MINFNKNLSPSSIRVSYKKTSRKETSRKATPLQVKKKLTKSNKEFLKLIGLLK